ncbi:hypothetical protein GCM10010172_03080 [Paractinoplanes ferrugineus]|uniref:Uncharacterized protein n=1 Tax=Paractinoplanes ferrugineus TaxID=113564 RepID=A0A919MFE4_9ACTN|nr:hypothetical protein [Actinoplanes ferrugineus]GIE13713.1 hypothetical protein Afe05nite_55530 [Actinoplanes ferrugineus]
MTTAMPRRRLLRNGVTGLTGVAAGAIAAPLIAGGPAAAAGSIVKAPLPVGNWEAIVAFPDQPGVSELSLFAFAYDGNFAQTSGPQTTGLGWWRPTSTGFQYGWRHLAFDGEEFQFTVRGLQTATLTGKTFTSTGTGTAVAADGSVLFTARTTVQATWYGPA